MTEEIDKKEPEKVPTYRDRIDSLLLRVTKGEESPKQIEPEQTPDISTYKKMKDMGGLQKGLPELFKIDESAFDVPHFVTEENELVVPGSKLFYVRPPSNHPDADEYWARVMPHLKRIGKEVSSAEHNPGCLNLQVVSSKGEEETLRICIVRDEDSHDRPTLVFEYLNRDDLTPEEVTKFVSGCGLKVDRMSAKQYKGIIVVDATDK